MFDRQRVVRQLRKQGLSVEQATSVARELERLEREDQPATTGDVARAASEIRAAAATDRETLQQEIAGSTLALGKRIGELGSTLGSQIASNHRNTEELRRAVDKKLDDIAAMKTRHTRRVIGAAAAAATAAALISRLFR